MSPFHYNVLGEARVMLVMVGGVVSDGVARARLQAELRSGWHTKRSGGFAPFLLKSNDLK